LRILPRPVVSESHHLYQYSHIAGLDDHLRERYDASVVPGRWFEMPEHFRIGFALPTNEFAEALSRLGQALDDLK